MTLNYVLSALRRASENAYPWSVSPNEAAWLVAEVERLRAAERENAALRAEVDRLRILGPDTEARVTVEARAIASDMLKPVTDAWRAECDRVRAETVAYLHTEAERIRQGEYNPANRENALLDMADAIERGAHRDRDRRT